MTAPARCGRCSAARPTFAEVAARDTEAVTPEDLGWAAVRELPLCGGGVLRVTLCPACVAAPTPGTEMA